MHVRLLHHRFRKLIAGLCRTTSALLAGSVLAAMPGDVLLDSRFDAPDDAWKPHNGAWFFKDGAYCETTDGNIPYWSVAGAPEWTDVDIACSMKALDSGGTLFIAGRWQDPDNHYALAYEGRGQALSILRVQFGQSTTLVRRTGVLDIGGGKNPFGQFRLVLAGPILKAFIGDTCLLQTVDHALASGRVALGELGRRGVWDEVRVTAVAAPDAETVALQSPEVDRVSRETAWIRGGQAVLRYAIRNRSRQPMKQVALAAQLPGVVRVNRDYAVIPPGQTVPFDFPIDTRTLRSAAYPLKLEITLAGVPVLQRMETVTIAPAPDPERMDVINWTGLDPDIETHGFTATWFAPMVAGEHADPKLRIPLRGADPEALRAADAVYNETLARGMRSGFMFHNLGVRTLDIPAGLQVMTVGLDGQPTGTVNPHHPAVREWAAAWMRGAMATYGHFGGLAYANINSEWDRPFDYSPETTALYKRAFDGREPPRLSFPVDRKTADPAHLPVDGIIADDNPYYTYLLWWWREGQGWTGFNAEMARIIQEARPDIQTISEPTARIPALYGKADGCDIAQDWSYSFPSPRSILMTADFLVGTKRRTGQKISHDVQFLWKQNWVGPDDLLPSPDIIRECMWMNLSRPMDALFMWGTYLAIQNPRDPQPGCNPDTYEAFRDFADTVIRPFGPMIRKTEAAPKAVAVLKSAASHLFVKGWRWGPGIHTMNFYDALQAAQIPTDLILEADVLEGQLEKRGYRAVVLSYCETLPRSVVDRLADYAAKGGVIFADGFLQAPLPGVRRLDVNFDFYRNCTYSAVKAGKPDRDAVMVKFREIVANLRQQVGAAIDPEVRIEAPDVLYYGLQGSDMRLFTFINDRRQYGEWAGRFKTIHDAGVALRSSAAIRLAPGERVLYDLVDHRELPVKTTDGWATFDLELPPGGGRYVALYPERIAGLDVQAGTVTNDAVASVRVAVTLRGESGRPVPGLQPLWIEVRDGAGVPTEYSRHVCAVNGRSSFSFLPALNETGGDWQIDVHDLTAGRKARAYARVPLRAERFDMRTLSEKQAADPTVWDRD